jgi:hypothetical protein
LGRKLQDDLVRQEGKVRVFKHIPLFEWWFASSFPIISLKQFPPTYTWTGWLVKLTSLICFINKSCKLNCSSFVETNVVSMFFWTGSTGFGKKSYLWSSKLVEIFLLINSSGF